MLTDEDVKKLSTILASKKDLETIKASQLFIANEITEVKKDVNSLREAIQEIHVNLDGFVKVVSDLKEEDAAATAQLVRHEEQIQDLMGKKKPALA